MKIIVNMSGGKDSTAMALHLLELGEQVDEFIYADTGYDFPECLQALALFEEQTGRSVTRLKGWYPLEFLLADKPVKIRHLYKKDGITPRRKNGYGWMSPMRRWCTRHYKMDAPARYLREKYGNEPIVQCIGIAADEGKRIHADDPTKRYPLAEWGWTEADCMEYCKARGYYASPCAYDDCKRMSCYICPLMNLSQVEYLIKKRPELWREIKRLEARVGEPWKEKGTEYFEKRFSSHY